LRQHPALLFSNAKTRAKIRTLIVYFWSFSEE
jgi:hypothetical protein